MDNNIDFKVLTCLDMYMYTITSRIKLKLNNKSLS